MALPNRVDPLGRLVAVPERGLWMGNRGGRFHDPQARTTRARPYATNAWICCRLAFKDRKRRVWGHGYTELFFADEVTALAAGHRPCFECRRTDALAFAAAWRRATGRPATAPAMDAVLQAERIGPRPGYAKRLHPMPAGPLPDGTMALAGDRLLAFDRGDVRLWSHVGFGPAMPYPAGETLRLVTPPSIVAVLAAGYRPHWRLAQP
jgi:hypothetical protein